MSGSISSGTIARVVSTASPETLWGTTSAGTAGEASMEGQPARCTKWMRPATLPSAELWSGRTQNRFRSAPPTFSPRNGRPKPGLGEEGGHLLHQLHLTPDRPKSDPGMLTLGPRYESVA